jgi:acetone carboxylase gamma subunit
VWTINTKPFKESHFATYPEKLCEIPLKSGCPEFVCNKCGKAREKIFTRPQRPFVHRNKRDGDGDRAMSGEYGKWLNENAKES